MGRRGPSMTRRDKAILWIGLPLFLVAVGVAGTFELLSLDAPPPAGYDAEAAPPVPGAPAQEPHGQ